MYQISDLALDQLTTGEGDLFTLGSFFVISRDLLLSDLI
ncbi:hypothetical protein LG3211_2573 [Lysobacter gummosus]|nr:hypothetical protein LG3211_2573 [Lysobacter gummosus]